MRASITASRGECKHGRSTGRNHFADPRGVPGWIALAAMALKNGGQNKAAIDALDLKPGDSVIEIGCGPGMGVRRALRGVGTEGFVAGTDQSGCAAHFASLVLRRAVLRGEASAVCAQASDLPFREFMFDKAFAVNSFHLWPDPARALREIARVLAPKGRLVITQRAAREDAPSNFAGAAGGMERIGRATALLKQLGWRIVDERCVADGSRLLAVSVVAERPD